MNGQAIKRILVVDDDADYRQVIQGFLLLRGYSCEGVASADEALAWIEREPFDLIISDIQMDDKDGLQLMREAKTIQPSLLVLIMTGHYQEYSYSDIISMGAADFLGKPFDMDGLMARLQRIEREQRTLRELEEANAALTHKARINAKVFDLTRALTSPLSFETILELVLGCARDLTGSPLGSVGYMDPGGDLPAGFILTLGAREWDDATDNDTVFRSYRGLWEWGFHNRQPVLSNDEKGDPGSTPGHGKTHPDSSVPFLAGSSQWRNDRTNRRGERRSALYGKGSGRRRAACGHLCRHAPA
ncbi:MAG: response regulator [Syntrophobacteraceae bacterium]